MPWASALALKPIEMAPGVGLFHLLSFTLGLAAAETAAVLFSLHVLLFARQALAATFEIDDLAHHLGPIMSSGRTIRSNSSPVTYFSRKASSRNVVPRLCAVLAISAALS